MQHRKGATSVAATSVAATGPTTTVHHQDSNVAVAGSPLTTTFSSLLQRLTRLNTAIKTAMSKREEEIDDHEGYRRYL